MSEIKRRSGFTINNYRAATTVDDRLDSPAFMAVKSPRVPARACAMGFCDVSMCAHARASPTLALTHAAPPGEWHQLWHQSLHRCIDIDMHADRRHVAKHVGIIEV